MSSYDDLSDCIRKLSITNIDYETEANEYFNNLIPLDIVNSKYQTKDWRNNQLWYKNGKHNECELFQKAGIQYMLRYIYSQNLSISKTNLRLNLFKNNMINLRCVCNRKDGFEWSEDFDGITYIKNNTVYFNYKMVCGKGGAQTRTLRETYHFIFSQLNWLLMNKQNDVYVINILEGDECYKNMDKFHYLLNNKSYESVRQYVFIGDMFQFESYCHLTFPK